MAITVYENKEAGGARVKLDRRLCLTAAGKLVEDGHAEAATLYASAGKEVPRAEFEALGGVVEAAPRVEAKPEPKAEPKPKPKAKRKTTKKGK
jgi:hypothetical protein